MLARYTNSYVRTVGYFFLFPARTTIPPFLLNGLMRPITIFCYKITLLFLYFFAAMVLAANAAKIGYANSQEASPHPPSIFPPALYTGQRRDDFVSKAVRRCCDC